MNSLDLTVLAIYLIGLLVMGSIFARLKNTKEMFAAGGQSPWWLSGLSAFMTTFSAGTFVVWGGIAYRYGLVGVSILVVIGFAAILVGWFLAGRWKKFGYDSAAEFLDARFGRSIVQFYTWLQGIVGIFTMGGAVYALAVMVTALIPLPEGHLLRDPGTGNLSITIASLTICVLVILITSGGGLWAVLMTDALQFIILGVGVLVVVPLIVMHVGGPAAFVSSAPEGFFSPVAGEFTWVFLAGWTLVFFFKMGGEWAYVQRFACVPTSDDAKKSSYLFGILYIVSPIIWMLPPMAYRIIDANADYEQAYILACQAVLPAGMLGLMIAAMCSATTSTVTTQLNVFAGAITSEFYQSVLRPSANEKELVIAGRVITVFLGGIAIAGALLIPRMGTYTGYILASVAILTGPLVLPTIWGLYSKKIGLGTAWSVTIVSIAVGLLVKIGFQEGGSLAHGIFPTVVTEMLQANPRVTEIAIGTLLPLMLLVIAEATICGIHPGWESVVANRGKHQGEVPLAPSSLPARLCGGSILIVAAIMMVLAFFDNQDATIIASFAIILGAVGALILMVAAKLSRQGSSGGHVNGVAKNTSVEVQNDRN